jgi:hypothetical protein
VEVSKSNTPLSVVGVKKKIPSQAHGYMINTPQERVIRIKINTPPERVTKMKINTPPEREPKLKINTPL